MSKTGFLKLGIIGHGFVGKATDFGFSKKVNKFIVDPYLGTNIDDLVKFNPSFIFICAPTPMSDDGTQDIEVLRSICKEVLLKLPNAIKIIKSTVLPKYLAELEKNDPKLIYNPEFLREKNANEDFINVDMIIIGGNKEIAKKVAKIYRENSKCKYTNYIYCDIVTASLLKYTINSFLASKVVFFNEIKSLFNKAYTNDSWEDFINIISNDKRIGSSHMNVPGHDGKNGFGGACFPKDTLALCKYADELESSLTILKSVIKKNNQIRLKYKDLDGREIEQNINYDKNI